MQRILTILVTLSLCGGAMHAEDPDEAVRLRFEPINTKKESGGGANFTSLSPAPGRPGALSAMVHAGMKDTFPIQDEQGAVLFRVTVPAATDDQFTLQITKAGKMLQMIRLKRDQPVTANIAAGRFVFYYPSTYVSSTEKNTTNKALLIVTKLAKEKDRSATTGSTSRTRRGRTSAVTADPVSLPPVGSLVFGGCRVALPPL